MSVQITYFVHGTTTDNEQELASGWNQAQLSELGITQAQEVGDLVKNQSFDCIFCSDLQRAIDTCSLAFQGKYPLMQDQRLREADYGDFTQKPSKSFKNDMETKYINSPFPNGESLKDVEMRIADFLNFLRLEFDGKHIAIVAHQAPQLALEVLLNDKTWKQAIQEDWRHTKSWKPGWHYLLT